MASEDRADAGQRHDGLRRGLTDIRFIQEMLGHAKLTEVYTRVSIAKLKAVHTATHPTALLEGRRRTDEAAPAMTLEIGAHGDAEGEPA